MLQGKTHPLLANLVTSGTAVGLATACTQPMDVLKVRMQLEALVKGHRSVGMVRAVPLFRRSICDPRERPSQQNILNSHGATNTDMCTAEPWLTQGCVSHTYRGAEAA
jgi:hypothetical protein